MNVNRIPTGTPAVGNQQTARTAANPYEAAARRPDTPAGADASAGDRVELSAEARARMAEHAHRHAEMERARRLLHDLPEQALTPEREAQLAERVEQRFYDHPAVTSALAQRLADGLGDV